MPVPLISGFIPSSVIDISINHFDCPHSVFDLLPAGLTRLSIKRHLQRLFDSNTLDNPGCYVCDEEQYHSILGTDEWYGEDCCCQDFPDDGELDT